MRTPTPPMLPPGAEPCVWMSAGLVSYKLCDRDFDCDRCPLDRALRGASSGLPADPRGRPGPWEFPPDRRYSPGHVWSKPRGRNGRQRLGLDAFAVALLGTCRAIRGPAAPGELAPGDTYCELDLGMGTLPLRAAQGARLEVRNEGLVADPTGLLERPYDAGWLVEVALADDSPRAWLPAADARERAEHDLRRFRRGAALHMLVDRELGPVLADGGTPLTDLRQLVGGSAYLELLRDLVH